MMVILVAIVMLVEVVIIVFGGTDGEDASITVILIFVQECEDQGW